MLQLIQALPHSKKREWENKAIVVRMTTISYAMINLFVKNLRA